MLEIKVKYFEDYNGLHLENNRYGDWIDLPSAISTSYQKGEVVLIPLGVAMKLPKGYEARILPRSSTILKYGLVHVGSGVIDEDYCGDNDGWVFMGYAVEDNYVSRGDRICQFRLFKKMEDVEFKVVPYLDNPDRGGFGSTGK